MRRKLKYTLLAALLFIPLGAPAVNSGDSGWDLNETVNQTNFIVDDRCSGTLISLEHKLILTNYHCIDHKVQSYHTDEVVDGEIKRVEKERLLPVPVSQKRYGKISDEAGYGEVGEAEYQTEIIAKKKERDLALLQLLADEIPHSTFSPVLPESMKVERGDTAYHVGNPAMLDATVTRGIISSVTRSEEIAGSQRPIPFIQYDGGAFPGSSGGAIYNAEGYLIGNVTSGFDSSFVLAIHPELIQSFLNNSCWPVHLDGKLADHCADYGEEKEEDEDEDED